MKIKKINNNEEMPIKRFYPPFEITDKCPKCGEVNEFDYYFSYPKFNEEFEMDWYCYGCEHEWTKNVVLLIDFKEINNKGELINNE